VKIKLLSKYLKGDSLLVKAAFCRYFYITFAALCENFAYSFAVIFFSRKGIRKVFAQGRKGCFEINIRS